MDARSDVIDREIDPNAIEPAQMLCTHEFVAKGTDISQPKKLRRITPPWSTPAAAASALRGEDRFGIAAGNSPDGEPSEAAKQCAEEK